MRERIFEDVLRVTDGGSRAVPRGWLLNYTIDGEHLPLIDAQGRGIRNPSRWDRTLSVTTTEGSKYQDLEVERGVWRYPYCIDKHGNVDPSNTKLKRAVADGTPVIYFYKPVANMYLLVGLVQPVIDNPVMREFTIALTSSDFTASASASPLEREWVKQVVERRLHQPRFRAIVLEAYGSRCAICALPDAALVDAAHIRSDKDVANGQAVIENGLALCAIHHRAYDAKRIGIDGNYKLHVRPDIMSIQDGPILDHGIQSLEGSSLQVLPVPAKRPDPYRLELTFKEFSEFA